MAGRRNTKGQTKRDEIVDVALEVFATVGYDRASVREIARRAGLSQAGLLHHFPTKQHLFLEVLRRRERRDRRFHAGAGGHDVSVAGLVEIVRHNALEPGLVRLFVAMSAESSDTESPAHGYFGARYRALLDGVAADLESRAEAAAAPVRASGDTAASLLVAVADGLQIQWLLAPDRVDMADRLRALAEIIQEPTPESGASAPLTTETVAPASVASAPLASTLPPASVARSR